MYGRFDPIEVGAHIENQFLNGIERAMAVRERVGEDRFFDVDFVELCNEPGRIVSQITDHFDLTPISQEAVDGYLNTKRQDAKGAHKYSVERYGLDTARIYERYRPYIERFQIPVKGH